MKTISERREQEKERVAPTVTARPAPIVQEVARPQVETPKRRPYGPSQASLSPSGKRLAKGGRKPKAAVAESAPSVTIVRKGPLEPVLLPPVEPPVRYGTWAQVNGDYEHRNASGPTYVLQTTGPGIGPVAAPALVPLATSVTSRAGTVGFQLGGDFTSRGVFDAGDGLIVGAMGGFLRSDLTLSTLSLSTDFAAVHNGSLHMDANLTGGTVGLYGSYFNDAFSADFLAKADIFSLGETFADLLAFQATGQLKLPCGTAPCDVLFSKSDPIPVINTTLMANLNYRIGLQPGAWIEPTVGAQYTHTSYPVNAYRLGLEDGDLVMLQGGARLGTNFVIGENILTTATLAGLVYDDVLVAGGFIPGLAFQGSNLLVHADEGQVRGRGVLAFNFDLGQGLSSFIQGEVRGGKGLIGAGGKVGVRYQW